MIKYKYFESYELMMVLYLGSIASNLSANGTTAFLSLASLIRMVEIVVFTLLHTVTCTRQHHTGFYFVKV